MAAQFTELQKDKLMHMFELLDVDGNGVLEYDDFRMVVDTMAEERGLDKSSRRYLSLVASNKRLWKMFSRSLDANNDGSISLAEWLAFHIKAFITDPLENGMDPEFSSALDSTARFFLELLDSDGDGVVTVDDYIMFCAAYGADIYALRSNLERVRDRIHASQGGTPKLTLASVDRSMHRKPGKDSPDAQTEEPTSAPSRPAKQTKSKAPAQPATPTDSETAEK